MDLKFIPIILYILGWTGPAISDESEPLISLNQGQIKGFMQKSSYGKLFFTFLGIPYAEPPLGKLQFKDPVDHRGWNGVRDATEPMPLCSQINQLLLLTTKKVEYVGNPDCLFVNVHTPKLAESSKLPVMVYIHGGAFWAGSGNFYEPDNFLNEEIVLVTVNYRLGIQGFLSTGDDVISGNFGLKDQTLALKWVQKNVHKFGGDPNQVTIFGNSAGGASVHFHLLSERSQGTFTKAIIQSGSLLCPWAKTDAVKQTALEIGELHGCFKGAPIVDGAELSWTLLRCLQELDDETLTSTLGDLFDWTWFPGVTTPHVDGDWIPHPPEILVRSKVGKPVDVILGVTKDEGAFITNCFLAYEPERKAIVDNFKTVTPLSLLLQDEEEAVSLAKKAYNRYVGGIKNEQQNFDDLNQMFGDRHFSVCTDWTALAQVQKNTGTNKKVYYYELHHRAERSLSDPFNVSYGGHWVSHADEVFVQFPMKKFFGEDPFSKKEDLAVRDLFITMWTNFAKNGNPTPDDSLGFKWDEFTEESPGHLVIKPEPYMQKDYREETREFWASLSTIQNHLLFDTPLPVSPKEEL